MDVAAAPTVAFVARRAQRDFEESRVALLGVLGAFVFAAQMINFPVGPGTTGHLVGGALLSFTLGPAAASIVFGIFPSPLFDFAAHAGRAITGIF